MSEDGEGAASSAVWAIALIIIVAMIVGAMYYSGFLGSKKKTEIDVNISAPTR
jgi:flagellar basal body-associated protein FliL